jgi:hypothetical protein
MKLLPILISVLLFIACNDSRNTKQMTTDTTKPSYEKLLQASWLLGTWHDVPKITRPIEVSRELTEIWHKDNDSTLNAESFVISVKDTVFYESIKLQERNNDIHYVVSVKGQNNEAPVSFKLTSIDTSKLVFENPSHDFPSKIIYTRITKDSLYAEISGIVNGQAKKVGFPFKKIAQ